MTASFTTHHINVQAVSAPVQQAEVREPQRVRFSLRFLLLLTLTVSCWLAFLKLYPHFAVFGMGFVLAAYSAKLLFRPPSRPRSMLGVLGRATVFLAAWFLLYVLSVGPLCMLDEYLGPLDDEAVLTFYAPVVWLHGNTPLRDPLENYAQAWRSVFREEGS